MRIAYMRQCLTTDVIGEYFDGLASADEARRIEIHLIECPSCGDVASRLFASSSVLDQWTAKTAKAATVNSPRVLQAAGRLA